MPLQSWQFRNLPPVPKSWPKFVSRNPRHRLALRCIMWQHGKEGDTRFTAWRIVPDYDGLRDFKKVCRDRGHIPLAVITLKGFQT